MNRSLTNVLVVLAMASGVVLIAITSGLFPAAQPQPIETVPMVLPKRTAAAKPAAKAQAAVVRRATALALCAEPAENARFGLFHHGSTESLLVWCRDGYALFHLDLRGAAPSLTKNAHLPTKMPRAGGALFADLSADGVADLVVAVSPEEGVVHAPGSGVFLAKGRVQGGFEAAYPLLEMPVVMLAAVPMRQAPAAADLMVLTRGDPAARRQGQLLWFESGATPIKKSTLNAGLVPRDLRGAEVGVGGAFAMLAMASEPGRVIALDPSTAAPEHAREAVLPEAAQFCSSQDPRFVLARTTHDLLRVVMGDALVLEPWFRGANVGACASSDLDKDGAPDVLAVTDAGVIWLRDMGEQGARELTLPAGYRAIDVAHSQGANPLVLALVRDTANGRLVLLTWPALPWTDTGALAFSVEGTADTAALAEIPLE